MNFILQLTFCKCQGRLKKMQAEHKMEIKEMGGTTESVQRNRKPLIICVILVVLMTHFMFTTFHVHVLTEETHLHDTILLIWFWPTDQALKPDSCSSKFNIDGCHLTADRSLYTKADGVLIHHKDIAKDLSNLPKLSRPFSQKWIWMLFESPEHSTIIPGLDNIFNITMSYREDADIVFNRKLVLKTGDTKESSPLPTKTKSVCWLDYDYWDKSPERLKYFNNLKEHITVEVITQHPQNRVSAEIYSSAVKSCKFYLALESTKHFDKTPEYVAEKLYNSLSYGTVPVVWGPSKKIYESLIPRGSFIHADDFNSLKDLADYLHMLDKNGDNYEQFLWWRKIFRVTNFGFPLEHSCLACNYIRECKDQQLSRNLNQWFWGGENS